MLRLGACLLCLPLLAVAVRSRVSVQATANPVRKVINLLQKMQKKIEQEGETEKELFDKFMCYCKTGAGDLSKSIAAAEDKIPMLETQLKAGSEAKVQSDDAAKEAKTDRADAKDAMAEATAVREKQAADFASLEAEYTANIGAIAKAVAALEKGMGEAFLQTDAAAALRSMLGQNAKDINDGDRDTVLSFLSSSEDSEYAPRSGEITGILKQMGDEMQSSLSDARAQEASAIKVYDELVAAKTEEVNALTKQIETKTQRSGELAVANAQMANDIEDSKEGLAQDKEFLAELQKSCGSKGKEWEDRVKVRQEETVALAETIKILNDDDALDLFKKTLPPPGDSLLQVKVSQAEVRARARKILLKAAHGAQHGSGVLAGFVAQALHGKKIGFDKVTVMIDKMIQTLMAEQKAVTVETLESLEALELTAAAARGPPDSLRKTKLCKFHLRSRCSRGELCSYAHSVHELSPLPDLYKTRLCYSYVRLGSCEDAKCRHAHGVAELRPGGPVSISELTAQIAVLAVPRALEPAAAAELPFLGAGAAGSRGRGLEASLAAAAARGRLLEAVAGAPDLAPPPGAAGPGAAAARGPGLPEEGAGVGGHRGRWWVGTYDGLPGLHGVVPL